MFDIDDVYIITCRVQAELKPKELLNNLQQVTQLGVPTKKRSRSKFCDMIKEASPSTGYTDHLTFTLDSICFEEGW